MVMLAIFMFTCFCDKTGNLPDSLPALSLTQQLFPLRATGVSRDKESFIRVGERKVR